MTPGNGSLWPRRSLARANAPARDAISSAITTSGRSRHATRIPPTPSSASRNSSPSPRARGIPATASPASSRAWGSGDTRRTFTRLILSAGPGSGPHHGPPPLGISSAGRGGPGGVRARRFATQGGMVERIWERATAEFFGTLALIFIGAGSVVILQGRDPASLVGIALATGIVLAVMVSVLGHISGGHFNPAVTISAWVTNQIKTTAAGVYILVQVA